MSSAWQRLLDRRPRLILVLGCLAAWLPGLTTLPATDRDESRFVQATRQMLESGNLVEIRNGPDARDRKPIGIYWLQLPFAATARALGVGTVNPVWPYRIPSVLGGLAAVLATFSIGRAMAGARTGLLAAALLGGSVLLASEVHLAKTDAALLGATTLAMAVLHRAWRAPPGERSAGGGMGVGSAAGFWLAVAAGVLIKGPITPLIAGATVLTLVVADRDAGWLRPLRARWGLPLALGAIVPWFAAIGFATHGRFFTGAAADLGGKLAGADDGHGAWPGYHALIMAAALFPSGAWIIRALPSAWAGRRDSSIRFLLAWAGPAWVVFEAVPTKLPHYTLPLYPALCLLAARWLLGGGAARRAGLVGTALTALAGVVLGGGAAVLPAWIGARGPAVLLGAPALLAAGLGVIAVAGPAADTGRRLRRCLAGMAASTLLTWAVLGLELPALSDLWIAPRLAAARAAHAGDASFAVAGLAEPSLRFALGTDLVLLPDGITAARFLAAAPRRAVAVEAREAGAFAAESGRLGVVPRSFAETGGFNLSNGRRVSLTLFDAP